MLLESFSLSFCSWNCDRTGVPGICSHAHAGHIRYDARVSCWPFRLALGSPAFWGCLSYFCRVISKYAVVWAMFGCFQIGFPTDFDLHKVFQAQKLIGFSVSRLTEKAFIFLCVFPILLGRIHGCCHRSMKMGPFGGMKPAFPCVNSLDPILMFPQPIYLLLNSFWRWLPQTWEANKSIFGG